MSRPDEKLDEEVGPDVSKHKQTCRRIYMHTVRSTSLTSDCSMYSKPLGSSFIQAKTTLINASTASSGIVTWRPLRALERSANTRAEKSSIQRSGQFLELVCGSLLTRGGMSFVNASLGSFDLWSPVWHLPIWEAWQEHKARIVAEP